jgi:hypothetical protein
MALAATLSWGQENSIRLDGGPSWKGFSIRFSSKLEPDPTGASSELGGTVIDLPGGVVGQRFIDDPAHKRSFGYDVRLIPSADGSTAEIRIEPLHAAEHAVQRGWTQFGLPAGLPKYPVIPGLSVGDTVALDLLVNPSTGQKIVDYITLERQPVREPVHDFSLADVRLFLDRPHVLLDGKLLESTADFRGGVVWLYVEGRGRFVFSLFPNQKLGFRDSGMVAGNALTFRDGTTEFRVECKSAVAPGQGPYNLYVVREPNWRPRGATPRQNIQFGSADRAESVVEKK